MYKAYLLLGSNLGDRLQFLQRAQMAIQQYCGKVNAVSSVYQTAAWGLTNQPDFYNQVVVIDTALHPEKLMLQLLQIEEDLGRIRTIKFGARTIDIDILLIDDLVLQSPVITIPHVALPQRRFALLPLAEVAPQLWHPVEKKTITALLNECIDALDVQKITFSTNE